MMDAGEDHQVKPIPEPGPFQKLDVVLVLDTRFHDGKEKKKAFRVNQQVTLFFVETCDFQPAFVLQSIQRVRKVPTKERRETGGREPQDGKGAFSSAATNCLLA